MTSFTVCGFHEPALLLNQSGGWFGGSRRTRVIRLAAEQSNRFVSVEFANLFAPDALHIRSG